MSRTAVDTNRFRFLTSQDKIEAFRRWLQYRIHQRLLGEDEWWVRYVRETYRKGVTRAYDDTRRKRTKPALRKDLAPWYEAQREQFLQDAFNRPASVEKVKLLASRVFTELSGITEEMSMKLTRVLTDGLIQGKSPRALGKEISESIDGISRSRAERIARTELVRVHAEGQLDSLEAMGMDKVGVMVEWSTAGDDRVCDRCGFMDNVVLDLKEARGLIPVHPSCRCAFIPANVGEDTRGQVRGRAMVQRAFKRAGITKRVSKKRVRKR